MTKQQIEELLSRSERFIKLGGIVVSPIDIKFICEWALYGIELDKIKEKVDSLYENSRQG